MKTTILKSFLATSVLLSTISAVELPQEQNQVYASQVSATPNFSSKEINRLKNFEKITKEIDTKLDMKNLSNNTLEEINSLSPDAKEFYNLYRQELKTDNRQIDKTQKTTMLLQNYFFSDKTVEKSITYTNYATKSTSPLIYKGKVSHSDIVVLNKVIGLHGFSWTTITAVAAKYGKNPTVLGLVLFLAPMGWTAIMNVCDLHDKGFRVYQIPLTASHTCIPIQ